MTTKEKILLYRSQINELERKIKSVQNACPHPTVGISKINAWGISCTECGYEVAMTTSGSAEFIEKWNSLGPQFKQQNKK